MTEVSERAGIRTLTTGAVLEVTLDRPKANAIDLAASRRLNEVFTAFRDDPALRVCIVTGAGDRFFSPGWDLKAAAAGERSDEDWGSGGFGGLNHPRNLDKPLIAAVNGIACGGGFEIVLGCDIIVMEEHARFALPEINVGVLADAGTIKLRRRIPYHVAVEFLMTGRWMDAAEAKHWGLANHVVPQGQSLGEGTRDRRPARRRPASTFPRHQTAAAPLGDDPRAPGLRAARRPGRRATRDPLGRPRRKARVRSRRSASRNGRVARIPHRSGLQPQVGQGRGAPIGRNVDGAACQEIDPRRDGQSHQHRYIDAAERAGHRPGVLVGAEERDHRRESGAVSQQTAPLPTAIHAAGIEDLAHGIVSLAHQIEIHEVDRRPRREKIQQQRQQRGKVRQEVRRRLECDHRRNNGSRPGSRRARRRRL